MIVVYIGKGIQQNSCLQLQTTHWLKTLGNVRLTSYDIQWDQCTQDNSEASNNSSKKEFYTF